MKRPRQNAPRQAPPQAHQHGESNYGFDEDLADRWRDEPRRDEGPVWYIRTFGWQDPGSGDIYDVATIDVRAMDEDEAMGRAMALLERPGYRTDRVDAVGALR